MLTPRKLDELIYKHVTDVTFNFEAVSDAKGEAIEVGDEYITINRDIGGECAVYKLLLSEDAVINNTFKQLYKFITRNVLSFMCGEKQPQLEYLISEFLYNHDGCKNTEAASALMLKFINQAPNTAELYNTPHVTTVNNHMIKTLDGEVSLKDFHFFDDENTDVIKSVVDGTHPIHQNGKVVIWPDFGIIDGNVLLTASIHDHTTGDLICTLSAKSDTRTMEELSSTYKKAGVHDLSDYYKVLMLHEKIGTVVSDNLIRTDDGLLINYRGCFMLDSYLSRYEMGDMLNENILKVDDRVVFILTHTDGGADSLHWLIGVGTRDKRSTILNMAELKL